MLEKSSPVLFSEQERGDQWVGVLVAPLAEQDPGALTQVVAPHHV